MFKQVVSWIRRYVFLLLAAIVVIASLFYYFFVALPDMRADAYIQRAKEVIGPIGIVLNEASASTEQPLFYDFDITASDKRDQAVKLKDSALKALAELNKFRTELDKSLGFGFGAKNSSAAFVQDRAHQIIAECQDILTDYSKVGDFLVAFYTFQLDVQPLLADERLPANTAETASGLRTRSDQISQLSVPGEFNDVKRRFAEHVDAVAASLESGQVQFASLQAANSILDNDIFELIASRPYTINNVEYLPDRLDSIRF